MAEEASAADHAAAEALPVWTHTPGGAGPLSPHEAARSLADGRNKMLAGERPKEDTQDVSADTATPAQESEAVEAAEDAAPVEEQATGETQDGDPEATPPLDRPRSWSKEKEPIWAKLDRETQQYLLEHDSEVSKGVRNAQNEAAEKLKGLTVREQAAEQARQQYEAALPALLQTLYDQQQGEFSDIKTMTDVENLARNDWPRYALWDAQQKKIAVISQEVTTAQHRQAQESRSKWDKHAKEQDRLLIERAPELADPKRNKEMSDAAVSVLKDIGFTDEEIAHSWNGQGLPLRDHRMQLLLLDGVKYREGQKRQETAKKVVAAKVLPPVQRPGAAKPANAGAASVVKILETQISKSSGMNAIRLGAQHLAAKRHASQ